MKWLPIVILGFMLLAILLLYFLQPEPRLSSLCHQLEQCIVCGAENPETYVCKDRRIDV